MVGLLSGDDRSVGDQREVDTGVGNQVGLELRQVDVEGPVKPQRGRDGAHDLRNKSVQVGVRRTLNVKVTAADVVHGLIVHHECAIRVL